jgi:hypothetical protein
VERAEKPPIRPLTVSMQRWLIIDSALVFITGVQLFVLSEFTDRFFAWTVMPPLTAAFMGAAYWASLPLVFFASRQANWARARVAVPGVWLFTALVLVATLLHLDRFHLDSLVGWVWLAVYAVVPPIMLALTVHQIRVAGHDPPRDAPMPAWFRLFFGLQGALFVAFGVVLFLSPEAIAPFWPWMLTPLTARAVAAWLVGLGVTSAAMTLENDWTRVYPALIAYITFGVLELVALARYPTTLNWLAPNAWAYVLFLFIVLAVGLRAWNAGRQDHTQRA